jgi:hypothetical protein
MPPDDGLQTCPTHVETDRRNKLRINSASIWFLLHRRFLLLSLGVNVAVNNIELFSVAMQIQL